MKFDRFVKYIILLLVSFLIPYIADAQFYVTGDDPGMLRWKYIETNNFKVIYPEENEALARKYAFNLEKYSSSVSLTSGYPVSGGWNTKMPVVLHTWYGENGSVAWAPKRMDLFTLPSPYSPEPLPWYKMLSIHESRHVTQMQFGMTKALKPFNWFFGEMFNILASLVYPGMATIEGDAVITETVYSPSGRGRVADFLNYYRVAFDEGIRRDWVKWRHGSQRFYTPDYYALGYITTGGVKTFYNCSDFTHRMYDFVARRPYRFDGENATIKSLSGKNKNKTFQVICDSLSRIWTEQADARAPYITTKNISKEQKLYTNYSKSVSTSNGLYTVKSGYLNSPELIKIDKFGNEEFVRNISGNISKLEYCDKTSRIWWSESTRDIRWSLKSRSLIHCLDIHTGKVTTFRNWKLLHNPETSPGGNLVSTTQYNPSGITGITILDATTGQRMISYQAPDSLQLVQTAWSEDGLFASAVSDNGYGIYRFDTDNIKWEEILSPQPVMIDNLNECEGGLTFTSDLDGENELYRLDFKSGSLIRQTRSRFGLYDYAVSETDGNVYFSKPSVKGKILVCTDKESLRKDTTEYIPQHKYFLAERLTELEKQYASEKGVEFISSEPVEISEPKKYSKAGHVFNVHSWAPFYVSPNNIMNMSFDKVFQAISLGASGIIQNRLATAVGEFGYSAHKDPYDRSKWRHGAHAKLTYSGWYPVLEASIDFNDRAARLYTNRAVVQNGTTGLYLRSEGIDIPSVQARFSAYIPFAFNSGGWYRGLVPKLTYSISNDRFDKKIPVTSLDGIPGSIQIIDVIPGKRTKAMQSLTGSVRFYSSLPTPNSAVYPKWGFGAELGAAGSLSEGIFMSPTGYAYAYGYLPGITREQGTKISFLYQQKLISKRYFAQNLTNTLPRGFSKAANLQSYTATASPWSIKFTADYAIPIYTGEWPIGGSFIYVKRLVLTPHFDMAFFKKLSLYSVGLSATFDLKTLVWIEWPCSIGVTASFNGSFNGKFKTIRHNIDPEAGRFFIGPVFSVSF